MRKGNVKMDEKLTIWKPASERHAVQEKKGFELRKFLHQNSEIVFRLLLLLCAISIIVSCSVTAKKTEKRLRAEFAQTLSAERMRVEQETLSRVKDEYGINAANAEMKQMEEEAKIVAKILYPMRDNREVGLHLACWAVFDRVDFARYSDNVYDVCSADQAFMGWSDGNAVLDNLYNIALEEVQRWHCGVRPMDTAFVYLYWSPSEIYLFDDAGHKFFESDWMKYIDSIGG